jgi:hypothetical protein
MTYITLTLLFLRRKHLRLKRKKKIKRKKVKLKRGKRWKDVKFPLEVKFKEAATNYKLLELVFIPLINIDKKSEGKFPKDQS